MPTTANGKFGKKKTILYSNLKIEAKVLWFLIFCYFGLS